MAARSHVDPSVNGRRLRPIYDYLDSGNNKKALQEAEKVLRKQKCFQCAKVLKALALLRLGRHDESTSLLQEVHAEEPTDDPTLQAMTICYRELQKPMLIAEAYEAAIKKDPQNEEFLTHLFMAYVRLGDYRKQQQVAMQLYKLKAKNPYYFWAVMSIVLQASSGDPAIRNTMLTLASRMTEKLVSEMKIEAEAEIQLYLLILEKQGNYKQAYDVIQGPLGDKLSSFLNTVEQRKAEYLEKLERWSEMNAVYKKLLIDNPDNWKFYTGYLNSAFKLIESENQQIEESDEDGVDNSIDKVVTFISGQVTQEERKTSRPQRGPYLARIELVHSLLAKGLSANADSIGQLADLLYHFYEVFGDKGSCCLDFKKYLQSLSTENANKLRTRVWNSLDISVSSEKRIYSSNAKQLLRHVTYLQMSRITGFHETLTSNEKLELARELMDRHHNSTQFGKDFPSTDFRPNDGYCVFVSQLIQDVIRDTGDHSHFWELLPFLEKALKHSPSNFQVKLLLLRLYNRIGAISASFALYESMDIKHIQHDTVGYLLTRYLTPLGLFSDASSLYNSMLKFFTANHKDTVDYLISSYKFGSFTKIQEFVDFRERLNNSHQFAAVTLDRMLLDLMLKISSHLATEQVMTFMEIDVERDRCQWEELRDNRDLEIAVTWNPSSRQLTKETVADSYKEELEWLKLRNVLLRCLAGAVYLAKEKVPTPNSITNGVHSNLPETLANVVDQFQAQLLVIAQIDLKQFDSYSGPNNSRLHVFLQGQYGFIILELLRLVLLTHRMSDQGLAGDEETSLQKSLEEKILSLFKESISKVMDSWSEDTLANPLCTQQVLETLTNLAETISFAAILLGCCHRFLQAIKVSLGRKSKRKKDQSAGQLPSVPSFDHFIQLLEGVVSLTQNLVQGISNMHVNLLASQLKNTSLIEQSSDCGDHVGILHEVQQKVDDSYKLSAKELMELLNNKIKYISSLKL